MILYFTGTGNSLEIAQILAEVTNDRLISIGKSYKYKKFDFLVEQGENLGFVFPTYNWSTPAIIDSFIKDAHFHDSDGNDFKPGYCYLVLSCSSFVGDTARFFAEKLKQAQNITLDAAFSVKSVGNCISLYSPAEGIKREQLLLGARNQAHEIAKDVSQKVTGFRETRNPFGILLSKMTGREEKPRSTKEFYTLETCTSCGQCADICPTNTITLIDGRPRWAEMGCTQCFACIHRCPPHAIQYGKSTETRNRFINPVLLSED